MWYISAVPAGPLEGCGPSPMNGLDELWSDLLSGNSQRIQRAWRSLADEERQAVLEHLARMRDEAGWHPAQRESAAAALLAIRDLPR